MSRVKVDRFGINSLMTSDIMASFADIQLFWQQYSGEYRVKSLAFRIMEEVLKYCRLGKLTLRLDPDPEIERRHLQTVHVMKVTIGFAFLILQKMDMRRQRQYRFANSLSAQDLAVFKGEFREAIAALTEYYIQVKADLRAVQLIMYTDVEIHEN